MNRRRQRSRSRTPVYPRVAQRRIRNRSRSRTPVYPIVTPSARRQSRQSRSRRRFSTHEVTIRDPERPHRLLKLNIPSYRECRQSRSQPRRIIYCGTKPTVPRAYTRRGTQWECLRKGFGAGRCSIFSSDNDDDN